MYLVNEVRCFRVQSKLRRIAADGGGESVVLQCWLQELDQLAMPAHTEPELPIQFAFAGVPQSIFSYLCACLIIAKRRRFKNWCEF